MHSLMVGGIILFALGLRKTLGQVDESLAVVPAFALLGGVALYLLGLIFFRYRLVRIINWPRLGLAALLFALISLAVNIGALMTLIVLAVLMWLLVAIEAGPPAERASAQ